jgi:ATPase subunit of ABC transporter with duplicated ATPase domains
MLLRVSNLSKSIGIKDLFHDLSFMFNEGEKVALIGRNGCGKTTLFHILNGDDSEYSGKVEFKKGASIILTRQEHFLDAPITALDYILDSVPQYRELRSNIASYERGEDTVSLEQYLEDLHEFGSKGYFEVEAKILQSLQGFQIGEERALDNLKDLSGGEKRFVELVRVMYSEATLALIDEPTNHMDYVGKEKFIKWLTTTKQNVFLISHDRDVLKM